ncbi:MAG: hypothetical protein WBK91_00080 [Alphaproteobacteria bacterium]
MKQNPVLYWVSVALCAISLFLVIGNILLVNGNKGIQSDINARQQQINASQTFAQIYQGLVQSLADMAVKQNDAAVRGILADAGIKFPDKDAAAANENSAVKKKQ